MSGYKTVEGFIESLDDEQRRQVNLLRGIILESHSGLSEILKWNAPSYVFDSEDRLTFSVKNKQRLVKLVLHMGALRQEDKKATPIMSDETETIEWSSDIRGILSFASYEDIVSRRAEMIAIIRRWLDTK